MRAVHRSRGAEAPLSQPVAGASEVAPEQAAIAAAAGAALRLEAFGQGELRELLGAVRLPPAAAVDALERAARALGRSSATPSKGARGTPDRRPPRRVTPAPRRVRRRPADAAPAPRAPAKSPDPSPPSVDAPSPDAVSADAPAASAAPPVSEATPPRADPHEVAAAWLDRATRYEAGSSAADWRRGRFDCSGFLLHVLERSGIDIGARVGFEIPAASASKEAGRAEATTYDLVHMTENVLPELGRAREEAGDAEVESILRRYGIPRRGGIDARVAALPEGADKARAVALRRRAERARTARLRELVEADDPRTRGVVHAMTAAGFGRPVEPEAIRPGDMVQTWSFGSVGVVGHAGIAHVVRCRGDVRGRHGNVLHDVDLTLDRRTDPASVLAITGVESVELLGAHGPGREHTGRWRPGGVYVKPPTRFVPGEASGFDRIHVGRPASSRWP